MLVLVLLTTSTLCWLPLQYFLWLSINESSSLKYLSISLFNCCYFSLSVVCAVVVAVLLFFVAMVFVLCCCCCFLFLWCLPSDCFFFLRERGVLYHMRRSLPVKNHEQLDGWMDIGTNMLTSIRPYWYRYIQMFAT